MKLVFLIFICLFSVQVMARETLSAVYTARGAGMHLMSGTMDLVRDKTAYKAVTRTQTRGLLSVLLDAKTTFLTEGKIIKDQFVVQHYSMTSISGNKTKTRFIDFLKKKGFTDYQTAVITMMNLPKPITKEFKIFDGKRDLRVIFTYQGTSIMEPDKYAVYAGPATYYTVSIDITAGKKKGWFFNRMKDKTSPPLHLYFAPIGPDGENVLVKAGFDTSIFGMITIYLTDLNPKDNHAIGN